MALRDLVTGNDACTADDGAGPSNAFAGLANTLFGSSSQKQQERLSELPGFHGLPGSSEARFAPRRPEDAALAAAESEQVAIPGMFQGSSQDVDDFMRDSAGGRARRRPEPWQDEFQAPHLLSLRMSPPAGSGLAFHMPAPPAPILPFLTAFFNSAKSQSQFQPLPSPKMDLSVVDQCRIRDRSTIMARHIFADAGDAFADQQVDRLLQSLHIDPQALPSQSAPSSWDSIFHSGAARDGFGAQDAVAQSRMRNRTGPDVDRWADQFANLDISEGLRPEDKWAAELAESELAANGKQGWAEDFLEGSQRPGWADEFQQAQASTSAGGRLGSAEAADSLQQTRALRDTMAASSDPKFQKSKFLQFVSKMSRGEIILEDNQAKEVPGAAVGSQWAEEHANEARNAQFEDAWREYNQQRDGGRSTWMDEFQEEMHPVNGWADQFGAEQVPEGWASEFADRAAEQVLRGVSDQDYQFQPNNPFLSDTDSFAKGVELFKNGLLSEAVLAFEAEAQRQPGNVEAWRLLGTVHAENDDDQQAIAALGKALRSSPKNSEVLLSLGVSYTNELDQAHALNFLMEWLKGQPRLAGLATQTLAREPREKLRSVVQLFRAASDMDPGSADVHVALGVLYNLSRDFDGAVGAFRTALQTRTTDYSLWNKLGATLANSGRSGEAVSAYQKALDLKPNYMRAWTNMGISQANIGEYEQSARFYVRALGLNPRASNVWGYLRTSLTCAGRNDLIQAVEEEELGTLQQALPL